MFLVPASCLHTVRSCRHVASVVSLSVRTSLQCTCSGYVYYVIVIIVIADTATLNLAVLEVPFSLRITASVIADHLLLQ